MHLINLKIKLTIVTFSEGPESSSKHTRMSDYKEDEMDESILDNNDEELPTFASKLTTSEAGTSSDTTTQESASATAGGKTVSVGSLSHSFMHSINMGSNDVFTAPKKIQNTTTTGVADRVPELQDRGRGGGLPREYEMVRVAQRNWLAASTLSGIGPLSRANISRTSGFSTGSLVVGGDSRHLAVQHYHSLKDKLNISMSFEPKAMVCVTCPEKHAVLNGGGTRSAWYWLTTTSRPLSLLGGGRPACWWLGRRTGCWGTWRASSGTFSGTTSGQKGHYHRGV